MRRFLPVFLAATVSCACAAPGPNRFSLVRSDSGADDDAEAGVFSLDDATLRLVCLEEPPATAAGETPPVAILCHGLAATKESALFDALSKALRARGICVARFDFNGHGESEGAFERMTVSNEVFDVETVVDHYRNVRGARVALVGHSQGGVVAALAAARLGKGGIEALALLAPAAVLREDALRGRIFDAVFDPLDPPETIPVMDGRFRLGRDYVLDAQETDPYPAIERFEGSLLVVHGQADAVVPWTYGQRFVEAHPNQDEFVLVRPADHAFTGWEDTVAGVVADFLAKSFGIATVEEAEAPAPAEAAPEAPAEAAPEAPAEAAPDAPAEVAPEVPAEVVPEAPAEVVPEAPAEAAPEVPAEAAPKAPAQEMPLELPPDIRGDIRAFLDALETQSAQPVAAPAEPAAVVAEPVVAPTAEPAEVVEPAVEPNAESAEVVEPAEAVEPAIEPNAEPVEVVEPAAVAEPVAVVAEPVVAVVAEEPAVEPNTEPAEVAGGEAAPSESTPAVEPPAVDSVQSLAAAYPALPIPPNGSVINILAAPNGLTWQGLEVEEEDLLERLRIFGKSIPDANIRIQAFPDTPFPLVKRLVGAASDSGFSKVSVLVPSVR